MITSNITIYLMQKMIDHLLKLASKLDFPNLILLYIYYTYEINTITKKMNRFII